MAEKNQSLIRNFCIISHIDHGKSTLADRFLELTATVPKEKLQPQYLDRLSVERERGITVKMQPVRMTYALNSQLYTLNLIDTPGHYDFSYEVSRSLKTVEGVLLLVDATQGIQAQTLANLELAQKEHLTIIPVLNKIDLVKGDEELLNQRSEEIQNLLGDMEKIFLVSAKTGEGVCDLLNAIVKIIPPPQKHQPYFEKQKSALNALVFDSHFDPYKGIIAHIRLFSGEIKKEDELILVSKNYRFKPLEVGIFSPDLKPTDELTEGVIGYCATGIKEMGILSVGEIITVPHCKAQSAHHLLDQPPQSLVFSSFFPHRHADFLSLRKSLERLNLNDPAFHFTPINSDVFSRGFEVGCRGLLHLQIVKERLEREFSAHLIAMLPSVEYKVIGRDGTEAMVRGANNFPTPEKIAKILEPYIELELLIPEDALSASLSLLRNNRSRNEHVTTFSHGRLLIKSELPLADFISGTDVKSSTNFSDAFKNVTSGYGSLSYTFLGFEEANVVRLDVLLNKEPAAGLSFIVPEERKERFSRALAERLKEILPRENFAVPIQVAEGGKVIARETLPSLKKDVAGYLYGGDRSRKMKLWKKQKRGKKRLQTYGKVRISPDIFIKLIG